MTEHRTLSRRDLAEGKSPVAPDMIARVEAALDGLEIFGVRGHAELVAYGEQLAREADRADCPEVATLARIAVSGNGKLDVGTAVALARKSLAQRRMEDKERKPTLE